MPYIFLILAVIAVTFITLGAQSVWVAVLSLALKSILAFILTATGVTALVMLWQRISGRKPS